ncbi:hypothetical protein ACIGFK_28655 [Streptomyces sp. NPDC085524]|uniref:hypothetical protein n=1 Tax=Streptomyces sp. NPDC085524 TaxID=3365728 RepID=UPI0037D7F232
MAEDNGASLFGVGIAAGVASGIAAQAAAQATAAALRIQYDNLKDYQKLVDDLLTKLQESPAHHGKLADGALSTSALGDFAEATKLNHSYRTVHAELQKLSKGLAVQIEALGLAVQSAGKSFAEVDEETKRRLVALAKQAHDQYIPDRDPYADKKGDGTQAAPNSPQPKGTRKGALLG